MCLYLTMNVRWNSPSARDLSVHEAEIVSILLPERV